MECQKFYLMGYFTASVIRLKYSVINLFQAWQIKYCIFVE
jgi:hypothetical protein